MVVAIAAVVVVGSSILLVRRLVRMYRRRARLDSVTWEEEETVARAGSRTADATVIVHEPGSLKC